MFPLPQPERDSGWFPAGWDDPSPYLVGLGLLFVDVGTAATATPDMSAETIQTNDIILVHGSMIGGTAGSTITAPVGEGWTVATSFEETVGANVLVTAFWKRWGAGFTDDTTPTFTQSLPGTAGFSCQYSIWRGCRTSGVPYDQATSQGNVAGGDATAPTALSLGPFRTSVRMFGASITGNLTDRYAEGTGLYTGEAFATTSGPDRAIASSYLKRIGAGLCGSVILLATSAPNNTAGATIILAPFGTTAQAASRYRRPLLGVGF